MVEGLNPQDHKQGLKTSFTVPALPISEHEECPGKNAELGIG